MTTAPRIPLTIRVTNYYPELNRQFTHELAVMIERPLPEVLDHGDRLHDRLSDQLFDHTGEGPEYADAEAAYFVEILESPDLPTLVGYEVAYGA